MYTLFLDEEFLDIELDLGIYIESEDDRFY
jgi:hypothetical protein